MPLLVWKGAFCETHRASGRETQIFWTFPRIQAHLERPEPRKRGLSPLPLLWQTAVHTCRGRETGSISTTDTKIHAVHRLETARGAWHVRVMFQLNRGCGVKQQSMIIGRTKVYFIQPCASPLLLPDCLG